MDFIYPLQLRPSARSEQHRLLAVMEIKVVPDGPAVRHGAVPRTDTF